MSSAEQAKKKPKPELPHGWVELSSRRAPNRKYYYNTLTKVSTWTHPCEANDIKMKGYPNEKLHQSEAPEDLHCVAEKRRKTSQSDQQGSQIQNNEKYQKQYFSALTNDSKKNRTIEKTKKHQDTGHPANSSSKSATEKLTSSNLLPESSRCPHKSQITGEDKNKSIGNNSSISCRSGTALDIIKKNYMDQFSSNKTELISNTDKTKGQKIPITDGKIKKQKKRKKKSKKLQEAVKSNLGGPEGVKSDFSNETVTKFEKFKIPKKNFIKSGNVLESKSNLGSDPNEKPEIKNKAESCDQFCFNKKDNKSIDNIDSFYKEESFNYSNDDSIEEMDWEPCDEEMDAKNINEYCQEMDVTKTISNEIFYQIKPHNTAIESSLSNTWILVLDTNILISCLNFVKDMRDCAVSGLGYPCFYIPWRVLQELDHLKNIRHYSSDKQLHMNARKAISYLNENFKSGHPRFCGQSFEDYSKISTENSTPDDDILKTCLQLKNSFSNMNMMLLTNDKNLESKAHVSNVETYSKEGFQLKYMSLKKNDTQGHQAVIHESVGKIDRFLCALKNTLKEFFSLVVETEMKNAFDKDWMKICCRKPPWSLQDTLNIIKKHWIAVFFLVFDKQILYEIQILYNQLFRDKLVTVKSANETVEVVLRLLKTINKKIEKNRPYKASINGVIDAVLNFTKELSANTDQFNNENTASGVRSATEIAGSNSTELTPEDSFESVNDYFNRVKDLFKWIWDSLKDFCDTLSATFSSPTVNNNLSIPEMKASVMQRYNELSKLINFLERGLELNIQGTSNIHPVIHQLSDFLLQALSASDSQLQVELPRCLTVFFSSPEGRNLLSRSLSDFKEFAQILLRANEFIERNCCSV